MSKSKQPKAVRPTANVEALFPMPPEGWEARTGWNLQSDFGKMSCNKGPAVRLVRLAEVLRWIEDQDEELLRSEALQALIDRLPNDVMTWLYRLDPTGRERAVAVDLDATFGYPSAADVALAKNQHALAPYLAAHKASNRPSGLRVTTVGPAPRKDWPEPTEPGRPALVKALNAQWSGGRTNAAAPDLLDHPKGVLTLLAVPVHKAFAVWGWGDRPAPSMNAVVGPNDWPSLVAYRKANFGSAWTEEQLAVAKAEWARRGSTVPSRVAMAVDLGISRESFRKTMALEVRKRGRGQAGAHPAPANKLPKRA